MYSQTERYEVIVPLFQKDGYDIEIHISGTQLNPDPSLTISRAEMFTFGQYPSHDIIVSSDKRSWGPNHCAEADVIAAVVWDSQMDDIIADAIRKDRFVRIDLLIDAKQAEAADRATVLAEVEASLARQRAMAAAVQAELTALYVQRNQL